MRLQPEVINIKLLRSYKVKPNFYFIPNKTRRVKYSSPPMKLGAAIHPTVINPEEG